MMQAPNVHCDQKAKSNRFHLRLIHFYFFYFTELRTSNRAYVTDITGGI